jgi:hypothetical protein
MKFNFRLGLIVSLVAVLGEVVAVLAEDQAIVLSDQVKLDFMTKLKENDRSTRFGLIKNVDDLTEFQRDLLGKRNSACSASSNLNDLFLNKNNDKDALFLKSLQSYQKTAANASDLVSLFGSMVNFNKT